MSYWDIDNFLAEQQKIKSFFTKQATGMQFIDPTKGRNGNLQPSQQFQAPIWILNILNDYLPQMEEHDYLKVNFPEYLYSKQFQSRVKSFIVNTRNSSLEKVNFQRQSPYFYQTYLCLTNLMVQQSTKFDKKLVGQLLDIRGKYILIRASSYVGSVNADMALNTYTDFEMLIYKHTKNMMEKSNAWKYSHKWLDKYNSLKKNTIK